MKLMDSCDNLEVSLQILRGFMSNFGLKLFHPGRDEELVS